MRNTQLLVWEIQNPTTIYQYQDTVEMQGTHLDIIMETSLAQGIEKMIYYGVAIVHRVSKVGGGITTATMQTSMVSTMVEHTHPMVMVWHGSHGRDTITLSSSLR